MSLRSITRLRLPTTRISEGDGEGAGGGGGGRGSQAADAGAGGAGDAQAGADGSKPYYEAFTSEELRTHPSIVTNFQTAEDLARGYVALEKRFGVPPERRLELPADQTKAEEMRAVWGKLGLPEKADGYGLSLDEKATDDDKAMLKAFTDKAFEWGLPAPFARQVMDFWLEQTTAAKTSFEGAQQAMVREGDTLLREKWGKAYDRMEREVTAAIGRYGGKPMSDALNKTNLAANAHLAIMIGNFLDAMAEPGDAGGRSGDADTGGRAMTPTQAKAEVRRLEADPVLGKALREREHPRHAEAVARRNELLAMGEGEAA